MNDAMGGLTGLNNTNANTTGAATEQNTETINSTANAPPPKIPTGTRYPAQKRTERHQHSRHRGNITDNSEKASPDTNPKRPQNRVNIV